MFNAAASFGGGHQPPYQQMPVDPQLWAWFSAVDRYASTRAKPRRPNPRRTGSPRLRASASALNAAAAQQQERQHRPEGAAGVPQQWQLGAVQRQHRPARRAATRFTPCPPPFGANRGRRNAPSCGAPPRSRARRLMIAMFDQDHSGTINFQEFQVRRSGVARQARFLDRWPLTVSLVGRAACCRRRGTGPVELHQPVEDGL